MFLIRRCNFLGHPVQIWILPFTRKKIRKTLTATFMTFLKCICRCVPVPINKTKLIYCWLLETHLKKRAGSRSLIQCTDPRILIKTSRIRNTGSSPDHRISKPRKITLTCQIRTVLSWLPEARCELSRLRLS